MGRALTRMVNIHPSAIVSSSAIIGEGCTIGPFTVIEAGVTIGANSTIQGFCHLGIPSDLSKSNQLIIGENSVIRSHSVIYEGSIFGNKLTTGHHVSIRENTIAGEGLQLGSYGDIQGDCSIGNYVRCHSSVHISQKSKIGNYVWLFPGVLLTNDPTPPSSTLIGTTIEDFAVIAVKATLLPGVTIGKGAVVGAHSLVNRDVEEGSLVVGAPAKSRGQASQIKIEIDGITTDAYPWIRRFNRGYPHEALHQIS